MNEFKRGRWYRFDYPNYGTPDGYPDYTAHSGLAVRIVRKLTKVESPNGEMYKVQARDGWRGYVVADELSTKRPRKG